MRHLLATEAEIKVHVKASDEPFQDPYKYKADKNQRGRLPNYAVFISLLSCSFHALVCSGVGLAFAFAFALALALVSCPECGVDSASFYIIR